MEFHYGLLKLVGEKAGTDIIYKYYHDFLLLEYKFHFFHDLY